MVVYHVRLADILGAVDWLCVRARVECLADAVSFLPEHYLFITHDTCIIVIELDDGNGCFGVISRPKVLRQEMDLADCLTGPDIHRAALNRVAAPDFGGPAPVPDTGRVGREMAGLNAIIRCDVLWYYRPAYVPRLYRMLVPGDSSWPRQ